MHYKNGRVAKNGDYVIGKPEYAPSVIVGIIQDINPAADQCNCVVVRPCGLIANCVTCGDLYHADDAIAAIEAVQQAPLS